MVEIGALDTPGFVGGIDVHDGIAYVTEVGNGVLRVIDVSNPASPVELWVASLRPEGRRASTSWGTSRTSPMARTA